MSLFEQIKVPKEIHKREDESAAFTQKGPSMSLQAMKGIFTDQSTPSHNSDDQL